MINILKRNMCIWFYGFHQIIILKFIDSNIDFIEIDDIADIEESSTVVKVDLSKEEIQRTSKFFSYEEDQDKNDDYIFNKIESLKSKKSELESEINE